MTVVKSVKIIRSVDRELINATLSNLSTQHLDDFESTWKPQLQASAAEDRDRKSTRLNSSHVSQSSMPSSA